MNHLTNLVQFPGLGLSFHLNRVAFTIGGISIYWYGVCIAVGLCLALVFAFRHSLEFGVDPDSMVDVILIGVVLGIISARAYYVAMAPFQYNRMHRQVGVDDHALGYRDRAAHQVSAGGLAVHTPRQGGVAAKGLLIEEVAPAAAALPEEKAHSSQVEHGQYRHAPPLAGQAGASHLFV